MEFLEPKVNNFFDPESLANKIGEEVEFKAIIHRKRILANVSFLILRTDRSLLQTVAEPDDSSRMNLEGYSEGDFIKVKGLVKEAKLKDKAIYPNNIELQLLDVELIHHPNDEPPFEINKKALNVKPETEFDYRPISLRHPKKKAIFKISETIVNCYCDFLTKKGFTQMHTPKIVFSGAEGGANIFKIDYFGQDLYLTQSPQFYKQYGVGIWGKVYEVAPVFRAEKHNTSRHINEYISLDLEMGFIDSFHDIMNLEIEFMKELFNKYLPERNSFEINLLGIDVPQIDKIPVLTLQEIHEIYKKDRSKDFTSEPDLAPEEEKYICEWSKKRHNSDFVFVTHFPTKKRPFYTMDDPDNPGTTLSFDLIFRGIEITTGGQRIHDYNHQVEKLKDFGLNPDDFTTFLQAHKFGLPPHGGLGMGLERLCQKICGLSNVKEAAMYPRDINRFTP